MSSEVDREASRCIPNQTRGSPSGERTPEQVTMTRERLYTRSSFFGIIIYVYCTFCRTCFGFPRMIFAAAFSWFSSSFNTLRDFALECHFSCLDYSALLKTIVISASSVSQYSPWPESVFRTPDDECSCKRVGSASVARLRARYAKPAPPAR
ncbi:hypothetical protein IG631_17374 [Alternaria alternata]|nr:hypothetical protein IG631_17374 [Alternaria alternata]